MPVSHRLRLKPTAVRGLLSPDSSVAVGLLGVSSVTRAPWQGLKFCNTVVVPGVGGTQNGNSTYLAGYSPVVPAQELGEWLLRLVQALLHLLSIWFRPLDRG